MLRRRRKGKVEALAYKESTKAALLDASRLFSLFRERSSSARICKAIGKTRRARLDIPAASSYALPDWVLALISTPTRMLQGSCYKALPSRFVSTHKTASLRARGLKDVPTCHAVDVALVGDIVSMRSRFIGLAGC